MTMAGSNFLTTQGSNFLRRGISKWVLLIPPLVTIFHFGALLYVHFD
jgi:hypothetical protein